MAKLHGVRDRKVFNQGNVIFHNNHEDSDMDQIVQGSIDLPPIGPFALLDFNSVMIKIEKLVRQMDVSQPSRTPNSLELDNISVFEWIQQAATTHAVCAMFPRV
eukprot:12353083-Ditylum_brightwellii.AAC.1